MPGNIYGGMEVHYEPTRGFLLYAVTMFSSGSYICHAKSYDKETIATYQLIIMRKGIWMCYDF